MISDAVPEDFSSNQSGMVINSITNGTIKLFVSQEDRYILSAYSVDGKLIEVLCNRIFKRGNHTLVCNLDRLAGKVLFLKGDSGHNSVVKKFVMYRQGIGK